MTKLTIETQLPDKPTEQTAQVTPKSVAGENVSRLRENLVASRKIRTKLKKYLSLYEVAAPKGEVFQVQPAIKLISVLVPNVIPEEKQVANLDTEEVRTLLDLLNALGEWQQLTEHNGK